MRAQTRGWMIAALGAWFLIAGWAPFDRVAEMWNDFWTGAFVVLLGFSLLRLLPLHAFVVTTVGLWMIISTFMPHFHAGVAIVVNNTLTGLFAIAAGMAVQRKRSRRSPSQRAA